MENRFKLHISKILQSAFNTCRPKNVSDVANNRLFFPENPHQRRLIDLFSPKPQPLSSSSCNPKPHLSRLGTTHFPANTDRQRSPSVPPLHKKTAKRGRRKKPQHQIRRNTASFSSITDNYYYNWWSGDEDDQSDGKTTLFSQRSVSSDSLEYNHKNRAKRSSGGGCRDRRATDVVPVDGIVVAKESSDPYEDFRVSMVDMIVEKGIFGVEDLENLVECFLSLNSEEHHKVQQQQAKDKESATAAVAASGMPPVGQRSITARVDSLVARSPNHQNKEALTATNAVSNGRGYINLRQRSSSPAHRVLR